MAESFSWNVVPIPVTGSAPNPGPFVPSKPAGSDARRRQFGPGIKFANVPDGRADFVVHGSARVQHVNSLQNVQQVPSTEINHVGTYSGAIKFRFRNYRLFPVPASVNKIEFRSCNEFTDPVFPFTGKK